MREYPAPFEELWALWPRRMRKDAAYRAWERTGHIHWNRPLHKDLVKIAAQQAQWYLERSPDVTKVPMLVNWLMESRWEDELDHRDWEQERKAREAFGFVDTRYGDWRH